MCSIYATTSFASPITDKSQVADTEFELETIAEGITRIELPSPVATGDLLATPSNVYLIDDPSPALINAGHPCQSDALARALRACDITPAQIERIIATSWQIDVVGGATQFPRADLFLLSPDMSTPRDYEMLIETRRQHLRSLAAEIAEFDESFQRSLVDDVVERYFPRMTRDLRFAPLRNGHFVQAGALHLEVLATAGPGPGHMALYEAEEKLLFCGDFAMSGLPHRLTDAQSYLVSLERIAGLPSQRVLPNRSRSFKQGRWTVSRAANFLNNFLSNAPAVLVRAPTVIEFIERDRGLSLDDPLELMMAYDLYRTLFDELVRSRTIAAEGQGLARRYGVDVDDPREPLRRD